MQIYTNIYEANYSIYYYYIKIQFYVHTYSPHFIKQTFLYLLQFLLPVQIINFVFDPLRILSLYDVMQFPCRGKQVGAI